MVLVAVFSGFSILLILALVLIYLTLCTLLRLYID